MAEESGIEWTDVTWNPVRGCTKISPGCKHCYAETFAERWRGTPGHAYEQGFDLRLVPHKLGDPLGWTKPSMVFVNSMSDLFQGRMARPRSGAGTEQQRRGVPQSYVKQVWAVMKNANWHTYQVLTKRAERMRDFVNLEHNVTTCRPGTPPLGNVWLGVSVENRKHGIPRIEHLRNTPAKVRFLSVEPLLEDLGEINLSGIDWVIVGGESGPGARPMAQSWVERIQRQCDEQGALFFFKQWGGTNKKVAGRLLHRRTWDAMPPIELVKYPGRAAVKSRRAALGLHSRLKVAP